MTTPVSNRGINPELVEKARRIVAEPLTRTIPWTGQARVQVANGRGPETREFAQAFLDAVEQLEANSGI